MGIKDLISGIQKPECHFYPVVMWFWNDEITKSEITNQIKKFKAQKIYTFFIHPFYNMRHDYLSEDFFQLIIHAVNTAKEEGMKFWIYDEYNWPSGVAGGKLIRDHEWAKATVLQYTKIELKSGETAVLDATKPVVAVHFETSDGGKLVEADISEGLLTYKNTGDDGVLIVTTRHEYDGSIPANRGAMYSPDNLGYLDLMNPNAVQLFFKYTHEMYKRYLGDEFGRTIVGVFTDEPAMTKSPSTASNGCLPYTEAFFEEFKECCGYDAKEELYLLYHPASCERSKFIKKDWYETCSYLFEKNFTIPYKNWCSENNLLMTGHLLAEEFMSGHVFYSGSFYDQIRHYDVPGIDTIFSKQNIELERFDMPAALVGSAAHYAGRNRVLCETYSGSGFDFNMSDMRRVANRLMLYGVNMLMFMGAYYTLKGLNKTLPCGYPPTHNHYNPQYKFYGDFCEYVSKLSYISAITYQTSKTLILYPYSTTLANLDIKSKVSWTMSTSLKGDDYCERTTNTLVALICALRKLNRAFEIGFDAAMENAEVHGSKLLLAGSEYEVIIVPCMSHIRRTTALILKQYIENGGKVIFANEVPKNIIDDLSRMDFIQADEVDSKLIKDFSDTKTCTILYKNNENIYTLLTNQIKYESIDGLCDKLEECYKSFGVKEEIEIEGKNIISNRRIYGNLYSIFLFNDIDKEEVATIKLHVGEVAVVLDINTMTVSDIFSHGDKAKVYFKGHDGKVVFAGEYDDIQAIASEFIRAKRPTKYGNKIVLNLKPNIPYNLYRFEYKMVKSEAVNSVLSLNIERMVKWLDQNPDMCTINERSGKKSIYMAENQALYPYIEKGRPFVAYTEFFCDGDIVDLQLCTEKLYGTKFILNGRLVDNFKTKKILHLDDRIADVSELIESGRNTLIVIGCCVPWGGYHCVPFSVLKGCFALENGIIKPFKPPTDIDITKGGYPFFAGTYTYTAEFEADFEKAILKLKSYDAVCVNVNDKHIGNIIFSPYELDISEALKKGRNTIELTMKTKFMNIFGKGESTGIIEAVVLF